MTSTFLSPQQQRELGWDIFPLLPRRKTVYAHYVLDGNGVTEPTAWSIDNGWQRLTEEQVSAYWPAPGSHNIGIATGARSGVWVLDVDVIFDSREEDDPRSQEEIDLEDEASAREYVAEMTGIEIPPTLSVRTASGKWHFYFAMPEDSSVYIKSSVSKLGPKIDVRGDGGMAMGICSSVVGEDGVERFYRIVRMAKPVQAPADLVDRVKRTVQPITGAAPASVEKDIDSAADSLAQVWIEEELQTLRNLHRPWVEGSNWHNTCFEVACTLNEFANSPWCSLTPETAQARYLEAAPGPERDWNPMVEWGEGVRKTTGQGRMKPITSADQSWFHEVGGGAARPSEPREPGAPVELVEFPSPREWSDQIAQVLASPATFDLASEIKSVIPQHHETPILASFQGVWYYWNGAYWAECGTSEVHDFVARQIAFAKVQKEGKDGATEIKALAPGVAKVKDVVDALGTFLRVPDTATEPGETVFVHNGQVAVSKREHHGASPLVFNLSALPFEYDPEATCPQWEAFLMDIFEHDPAAAIALQEWFGYFLLGDPSWLQKMFWLIGPKRSGKGTILNIANQLMGKAATAATLTGFSKDFGRENLIGKRLAIIDDARDPDPRVAHSVVEFLLTLSSGGLISVSRKYKPNWDGALTTCLLAASNTVPRLPDDGGAISSRLEVIKTRKSFIGHEDTHLGERLSTELPGILNWALNGLDRLREQGRFTQAAMAQEAREGVDRGATGATPFVQEFFIESEEFGVSRRQIRDAVEWWSQQQEDAYRPSAPSIKAALRAAFPDIHENVRQMLPDGTYDKHAWRGVMIRCRDCDEGAVRVSAVVGPECSMHLSNDFIKAVG